MTVTQAEKAIARAYIKEQILKDDRVSVSLLRKRTVRVTVMHDDPSYRFNPLSPTASFYSKPQRKISTVDLPVDQSSVLNALAQSGARVDRQTQMQILSDHGRRTAGPGSQVRDGDVVGVESADVGYFYTSGNLPGGQFPIPPDRNLTIQQAAAIAGGQTYRPGSFGPSEYIVMRAGGGAFRVSDPSRAVVRPGDTIILRHSRAERAGNIAVGVGSAALLNLP